MNTPPPAHAPVPPTILTLFASALLMAVFVIVQQLVFPTLTPWQSHASTIAFGALLATATAYMVSRRGQRQRSSLQEVAKRAQAEAALRASEERYRSVVENAVEAIVVVQDHVVTYANPQALGLIGYSLKELAAHPFTDLIHPEDRQMVFERHLRRLAGAAERAVYSFRIVDKAGQVKWVEIRATALNWQGRPATLNLLSDITDRKRAEQALAREQFLLRTLLDNVPDAIYFKDVQSRFLRINRAAAEKYGLSDPEQAIGKTDFDFFTPEHAQPAYDDEQQIVQTGAPIVALEECETKPACSPTWVSTTKMPLRDEAGQIVGTFGISRDITAHKQAEDKLLYLSIHDALTGLYNRTYFEEVLAQLSHGNPYPISVVVVDIDGMKHTNDTLGHPAGDELLRRTATVLRSVCQQGDISARIGGDEFALLLPQTDGGVAGSLLDQLRHTLTAHNHSYPGHPLSLSMGTATAYEYGRLPQTITDADQQMYRDKQEHRYQLAQLAQPPQRQIE